MCRLRAQLLQSLPMRQQTARLITAMRHPSVDVVGHLQGTAGGAAARGSTSISGYGTGRRGDRSGTAIEINSHLDRLDAPVEVLLQARGRRVLFVISTDAHRTRELDQARWGDPPSAARLGEPGHDRQHLASRTFHGLGPGASIWRIGRLNGRSTTWCPSRWCVVFRDPYYRTLSVLNDLQIPIR